MADIILTPIAELIIDTLGSAAVKEIRSVYGARDELSKLEDALEYVKAVLADAEKRQIREEEVRVWLQKLEDVLFDADDLVDEVNAEGLRRQLIDGNQTWKKVRTFCSPNNQLFFRHKMALEIKTIWERLVAISADQKRFRLEVAQEIQPERNTRETGTDVDEENVVGREREKMEILKRLMSSESKTGSSSTNRRERVSVIPIIGMGGLGKTTLTQLVYNDKEVEKHFSLRLWVCVSDNVDNSPLIEKVVRSITNASTKHLTMSRLEETVQEKIDGQRFLLILDDVWNPKINQEWERLQGLLGKNCVEGSRIIVTTRDDMVAEVMGGVQPCRLGHLDSEDSWNLFKKKAFKRVQEPADPTILEIAHKIVEKCKGVPLAINMIGSMLCFTDPKTEWPSFLEKELSNIPQGEDGILPTLKLSYDYLPSHLKPCFAYCSLFPQGYEFDVHTLITLWISQGLIRSDQSQSLEKIGHEYCKDLLWRSFFQEAKKDEALNIVKKCKMHDLVHGLAIQVAGEKYAMLDSCEDNNLRKSVRHISFDVSSTYPFKEIPSSWLQGQRIRSFLFSSKYYRIGDSKLDEDISNLKFLRSLDLSDVGIETVPDSVGKLNHLRYLDLSRNDIKTLPASITKLVNLQTLKLNWCKRLCELPRDIVKLVNLRHLELKGCDRVTHIPRGLSQLTNLQTISFVVSSENVPNGPYSKLDELIGMENVSQEVKIEGMKSGMVTTASKLRENNHLRSLHLHFKEGEDDASKWKTTLEGLQPHPNLKELSLDQYGGSSLSSFLPTLTNLVKLFLENCSKCQQLPSLDSFHSLKEMSLITLPSLEYITINEGDKYFSTSSSQSVSVLTSLQTLSLIKLPKFRGWWRSGMTKNQVEQLILPSFPRLSSLTIRGCENLTLMPRYPNIEGELKLRYNSWKTFEQTSMAEETSSSSTLPRIVSDSSYPLSKLTSVSLSFVMDLVYFPDERMKGLASLKRLEIWDCPALKYLSSWILYLTSLEDLHIVNCKEFEQIKWPETTTLTRLRVLKLKRLPKLKDVFAPDIQCLTSLEELEIDSCEGLEEIKLTPALPRLCVLQLLWLPKLKDVFAPDIQCLTFLEELKIYGCKGLEEIKLTPALPRLRVLQLFELPKLKDVFAPDIQCLTSLEELEIHSCEGLEEIKLTPAFPRLRVLKLWSLPKLKDVFAPDIQCLTSLEELEIHSCEGLEEIKLTPALPRLGVLQLLWLPKLKDVFAPDIQCLTSLEELEIHSCEGLEEIKLTPALPRLRVLQLLWLPKLKHLSSPSVQQYLTSLEELWIYDCEELQVSNDDSIEWQALTTLRSLEFNRLPQLVSLPGGLQFLTTLKQLRILGCRNFTGLPDWICKLSSLETLEIEKCPKFKSVPASISSLTSLQKLEINYEDMNPREIHVDLDLSRSASGSRSWKILKKFRRLPLCNK